ncbi:PEP-CTERM sorting domain-containing protein [Azohydromonas caseinilytica]|uniref:PEP-CTERM sorting domain-containing protein n=1 Tax=Azohydromonas caseinilytica TaxID=2728836 RepID=A0A848FBC4_9BURK|nr:PEP-CTERM sorting domain-containing protein [Azohydromonas caseinilytica]NML16598.1 PEP-CTERM sorting domain-containing protein [Azohydromonas caseinilytica]
MPFTSHVALRAGAVAKLVSLCVLLAAESAVAAGALRYRIEDLSLPDAPYTDAVGLNNRGEVALNAWDALAGRTTPSIYHAGHITRVDERFSTLSGLNDRGDLLGTGRDGDSVLLWRRGRLTDLRDTFEGGAWTGWARALNNRGQVTGSMQASADALPLAFLFDGRRSRYLPLADSYGESYGSDINRHGTVVGTAHVDPGLNYGFLGFVHDGAQGNWLPTLGPWGGGASAINDAGQIVGYSTPELGGRGGYLYADGNLTVLDVYSAHDINNRGWIVGAASGYGNDPYLYRDGQVLDLNALLTPAAARQWHLSSVSAINDRGQIIGRGFLDGQDQLRPFLLTPVPEPSATLMLLAGGGVIVAVARRRRRVQEAAAAM